MRLFTFPKRKPPATVRPEAKAPAEVLSINTRRIEITVEREWTELGVPSEMAATSTEQSPVHETETPEDKLTGLPVPETKLPNARLQLPERSFKTGVL